MLPFRLPLSAGAALAALIVCLPSGAEPDRSAAIKQLSSGATLAERSSAAFDQITPAKPDTRGRVDQIDPSLTPASDETGLSAMASSASRTPCILSAEQRAIVTSLEAQGRLPAGDCEMAAFLTQPGDKSEEDRRATAAAVLTAAPELVGQESEAARQARLAEESRAAAAAEAVGATVSTYLVSPVPGQ
ncbi:hypothetical protein [Hyphomonas sp.]|uniref:hypothetical protein n=1 Tax=Hyphomonas sp. TaxID=87 RepID=UPI00391AB74E